MASPQSRRDEEVNGFAYRIGLGMPEYLSRRSVPEHDLLGYRFTNDHSVTNLIQEVPEAEIRRIYEQG
jgi:hypothetical protein